MLLSFSTLPSVLVLSRRWQRPRRRSPIRDLIKKRYWSPNSSRSSCRRIYFRCLRMNVFCYFGLNMVCGSTKWPDYLAWGMDNEFTGS